MFGSTALVPSYMTWQRFKTTVKQPCEGGVQVERRHPDTSALSQMLEGNLFSVLLLFDFILFYYCLLLPDAYAQIADLRHRVYERQTSFTRLANGRSMLCYESEQPVFKPAHVLWPQWDRYVFTCFAFDCMRNVLVAPNRVHCSDSRLHLLF